MIRIFVLLAALTIAAAPIEKRVTVLEKRVKHVEKRVSELEKNKSAVVSTTTSPQKELPAIIVDFIKKKPYSFSKKMGIALIIQFENTTRKKIFAFNCVLDFKNEENKIIWSTPYAYSEILSPGDRIEVTLSISATSAKEYLKLVKASKIGVEMKNLETYGTDY